MTFPKLTRPEMARLVEIGDVRLGLASCGLCPATTKRLIAKGLVSARGGYITATGRVVWQPDAVLTDLGREVLAGLPLPAQDGGP